MIEYRKGDMLYKAPKGSIMLHACNCKGIWGSGIAAQFAKMFPGCDDEYYKHCKSLSCRGSSYDQRTLLGTTLLLDAGKYDSLDFRIACAFTSYNYGQWKDPRESILENTAKAIWDLRKQISGTIIEIHSPKINAGLFDVPWEDTAQIIEGNKNKDTKWVVWELE